MFNMTAKPIFQTNFYTLAAFMLIRVHISVPVCVYEHSWAHLNSTRILTAHFFGNVSDVTLSCCEMCYTTDGYEIINACFGSYQVWNVRNFGVK